ncbi:diguanylate cyclase [Gallaecimonas sp. GXIMD1310]|uniref:sensor domain-containing diguanylate cyclase n=1 Tax=Gallaecimonas sp. GXIMD1310 TaxID=3131926 RepID=UPI0032462A47
MKRLFDFFQNNDEFAQIGGHLSEGLIVTDLARNIVYFNSIAQRLLGHDLADKTPLSHYLPTINELLPKKWHNTLFSRQRLDVSNHHLLVAAHTLTDQQQRCIGLLITLTDITDNIDAQQQLQEQASKLKTYLEGTRAGTWEWNLLSNQVDIDERWARMLGYSLAELQPLTFSTWTERCHPDDLETAMLKLQKHIAGDYPYYDAICRMRHKKGHWVWIHDRGKVVARTKSGKPLWMRGTHIDVTESQLAQERLSKLAHTIPGIIYQFTMRPDGHITFPYVSDQAKHIYGVSPQALMDDARVLEQIVHPEDLSRIYDSIFQSAKNLTPWKQQYRVTLDDGIHWLEGNSIPEASPDGTISWYGMIIDITERKTLEDKLRQLTITDELTGLANRRHILDAMEEAFQRFQRYQRTFSLVLIDLDHFKEVNDNFGHPAGDKVLSAMADIFKERLRATDHAGRLGGEEFVLLLTDTPQHGALDIADTIRQALENCTFCEQGTPFRITLSAGVTEVSGNDRRLSRVLARADKAMYQAKAAGRNRIQLAC